MYVNFVTLQHNIHGSCHGDRVFIKDAKTRRMLKEYSANGRAALKAKDMTALIAGLQREKNAASVATLIKRLKEELHVNKAPQQYQ